ncbi:MAG: hypothetical protein CMF99_01525 [Candidatus Marinimicrobia bacterium]|nr:hypothetical protein [Candidatus Neomarinimicrobiota bacterium]|tara:strand:- start:258 stop:1388 length:1131 start_codon:yes stop_codon:yes gene_type:complete
MIIKVKNNKKWKILFTIPNFDTAGSGKALLNLCSRLDKKFFKSYISCSHSEGSLFKKVISSGTPFYINNNQVQMKPRLEGVFNCYQLSKFFKKLNMDLIHSFHYGPDYSEALAAKIAGIPWVYTKKNMNWGGSSKNGWKIRSILSSHILIQNRDMQNMFFKKSKKTSLVPRGVDTKKFFPKKKQISLIKKYNILESEIVILTVANLSPVKGIDVLLKSFIKLSYKYNFIRLFLVGNKNGDYGKMMENNARKSIFKSNIHFVGKVDEVIDYYSLADIFVLPTIKKGEGCPVSLLEAMSCGISPVGSNVSGIKDILDPFPNLLFSPGDPDSLAEKIENLILEKEDKKNIYRGHVLNKYDINNEVKAHEKIYKKILSLN